MNKFHPQSGWPPIQTSDLGRAGLPVRGGDQEEVTIMGIFFTRTFACLFVPTNNDRPLILLIAISGGGVLGESPRRVFFPQTS